MGDSAHSSVEGIMCKAANDTGHWEVVEMLWSTFSPKSTLALIEGPSRSLTSEEILAELNRTS